MMKGLDEFLVPYIISQIAAIAILLTSLYSTRWARILLALLFAWASGTNMYLGITEPGIYLDYAKFALPFYRDFINGWFSHNTGAIIPAIAFGQLLIAIGMLLKGWWVKWACFGTVLFLLGIAPLMVASAFPFSLIASAAALVILKKDCRNYVWLKDKKTGCL
jgi:hypothetical protein